MTDGNTNGGGEAGPGRLNMVLGGGLAVVLLAAIGATGGWLLAGEDDVPPDEPAVAGSATGGPSASPTQRPTATRTTPSAPRTSASSGTGLAVPPVIGTDFETARDELHERKLGWRLVFGSGAGRTVERTAPEVGAPVKRGATVTLYVTGPAPATIVPDLVGDKCDEAAEELGDDGLYPRYPAGRSGAIVRQEPAAGTTARWNDQVQIWCGAEPADSTTPAP
ncbi:PASTA domain-containing protein [Micromonospora sp. WMMD812]|uniref:PASTA domain-containing protein n=1 Tax=Micromonospora sp. WMMD812 TaxID=3015152 RepID=UPI00248B5BCD|nr:PASTA domain-containing protein [Micromonospora sp. WMMD812]WBB65708.1 PASTA domain-containing protein [Micromonospora sp. WMMD812]